MYTQHPIILYVGDQGYGDSVSDRVRPFGWHVFCADTMMDALSQFMFSYPDVCVVDAMRNPQVAKKVLRHLQSVNTRHILVIGDVLMWKMPIKDDTHILPADTRPEEVMDVICSLMDFPRRIEIDQTINLFEMIPA